MRPQAEAKSIQLHATPRRCRSARQARWRLDIWRHAQSSGQRDQVLDRRNHRRNRLADDRRHRRARSSFSGPERQRDFSDAPR